MGSRVIRHGDRNGTRSSGSRSDLFHRRGDLIDVVAGFGATHQPLQWLFALECVATDDWDPSWLPDHLVEAVPIAGGKPVAWSVTLEQHYSSDWFASTAHLITVKLTDNLVREELRSVAEAGIERLFQELLEITEPAPTLLSGLDALKSRGTELAVKHLMANPAGEWMCEEPSEPGERLTSVTDRGEVTLRAPGFASVHSSVYVATDTCSGNSS